MNRNGNPSQDSARKRRVERYAGEFLGEPSMSAPQPIPEKGRTERQAYIPREPQHPVSSIPGEQPTAPAPQDWAPSYSRQPYSPQPQWQQGYSDQQGYASPREPVQQGYPAQGPWQGGEGMAENWQWPNPQPMQGGGTPRGWQQSDARQAASMQPWQGTNGYELPSIQSPISPSVRQQAPAGMPPPPKGGSGSGRWKLLVLLAVVTALVGLAAVVICVPAYISQSRLTEEVTAYDDRFCEGVYVDDIHLGGMTRAEAYAVVNERAMARMDEWEIRLEIQGGLVARITAQVLGMQVDVNEALDAAWQPGHTGATPAERKAEMEQLLQEPFRTYTASPSGDTSRVDEILDSLAAQAYLAPKDAYVSDFEPNAHSDPFIIEPEVEGRWLNVEPLKQQIYALVDSMQSGAIELVAEPLQPSVTEAELRRQRTLRGTASTDISTTSTEGRTANIQRAFQLINGTVLKPGQSFSFNGIVGARTAKKGFYQAIEYAYGEERYGYGGGVCQASTTIYLAAVRANMTITKREPHSDKVNYTEYGLDATVNYDGKKIDLTFKNTTNSDVYILSYLVRSGGRWVCKVDIYGEALEDGVTYDLVAETVEVLAPPADPEYVEDKTGEYVTYVDETPVVKRKASEGCIVETFIVKYLNGKEVERTFVARDTYKAKAQQLWVGVSDREGLWSP